MAAVKRIHLVDASMYVFRAWHSMPDQFFDRDGNPVNAVHGFARFVLELLEREKPALVAMAFDVSLTSSFRNAIYPPYKANRDPAPESLRRQFDYCRELAAALGLCVLADTTYEADDLIGSVAFGMRKHGYRAVIVSADKDFGQLLEPGDEQWDYARGTRWGADGVLEKMGVRADQVIDYLALAGDAVDNIPGVRGIGAKSAAGLLAHFDTLDALLDRIDEVPFLRLRGAAGIAGKLREGADNARLSRQLSAIALDAPVPLEPAEFALRGPQTDRVRDLCDRLRIGTGTRRRIEALQT